MRINIENPCQKKCFISDEDICYGCFRTLTDIISWKSATEGEKECMLLSAKERKEKTGAKKYFYAFQV